MNEPGSGFALLLLIASIPLAIVVIVLTSERVGQYRRWRDERSLMGLAASFAWLAVALAFLTRPLFDLLPEHFEWLERLAAPGARIACLIVAGLLWWTEHEHNRGR
jgi:hypothetical protein